ncbi:TetR family transcriptional regulator [Actinoplanes sp. ATCC 53533]|uniref:TetR/AcrR family transcriptional regulator n=1 Tax=Actinoplanes sp. ATCC 53533 TaxID=1288362 RepID=UPI000F7AC624|nr:TetR/AcrR family transcriptional regulator [Actinoplanes sp. ATCC 53533]RSM71527.1 TetR family transcriptional regulator [Actinoplanes sp. ATCC 53533]
MSLRDRKRARTRQALVDAATVLFERDGYDETTVADIAAAAEIGTRTFFSYFASKEELLFPESDARVRAAVEAIAARGPDDGPAEVLLRALHKVGDDSDDMVSRLAALRLRLIRTVPAVRGRALQTQLDAQREIARHLAAAFPDRLDEVSAAALTGAFVGAVTGALQVLLDDPTQLGDPAMVQAAVRRATDVALTPWLRAGSDAP